MGLSVVLGIAASHHGAINVKSNPGEGTTFNVYLPIVERQAAKTKKTDVTIPTGNERILFVDDEESILKLNKTKL